MNDSVHQFILKQLQEREASGLLRKLSLTQHKIDFTSNDYLGIARNQSLFDAIINSIRELHHNQLNGSGGSRLLSGNSSEVQAFEDWYAQQTDAEAALFFNSGYDANLSLLSSLPQRGDSIISDSLVHASIIDGIRLSHAQRFKFAHNQPEDLEQKLKQAGGRKYVVIESVYSMDGDEAPLHDIVALCQRYDAALIVDEAHVIGIRGNQGKGLADELKLHQHVFARVHTFGKAAGCHGACVLGSEHLKQYLINFARPFIYSTALPPHQLIALKMCLEYMFQADEARAQLEQNIQTFLNHVPGAQHSAIQKIIIPGNDKARKTALDLQNSGFDVRAILSPTVPEGQERLRIILHAFNTPEEIVTLAACLKNSIM